MSTLDEITDALGVLDDGGCPEVTILHCNTQYPTPYEDANLTAMIELYDQFGLPVGLSDHTPGWECDVAATVLGAQVIEKHFTLDKSLPGWSRVSQYLSSRGFYLYQNTKIVYLPEGALLLEDILGRIKAAERFIFMEYFILAEGKLWDRMSAALCERARSGVEVKIIFDDFGNIKRFIDF